MNKLPQLALAILEKPRIAGLGGLNFVLRNVALNQESFPRFRLFGDRILDEETPLNGLLRVLSIQVPDLYVPGGAIRELPTTFRTGDVGEGSPVYHQVNLFAVRLASDTPTLDPVKGESVELPAERARYRQLEPRMEEFTSMALNWYADHCGLALED